MYRNTYVEVNLGKIKENIRKLIERYNDYKYYFGVVKANCYGHNSISVVKTIIDSGCNYLAVSTLDEALEIRKEIKDIPILCMGIIDEKYLSVCIENNITVTISKFEYLKKIDLHTNKNLKVHIKINSGMNRLGINTREEFDKVYRFLLENNFELEGIYTHVYDPNNEEATLNQYKKFEEITQDINMKNIPIVHVGASEATELFTRRDYANGCRLGIAMYGLVNYKNIEFESTFSLFSEVIQINEVEKGVVGYNGSYKVNEKQKIAVVPIGYADGIIRKNTGRTVYIGNKEFKIVGDICMDMLFVTVDDSIKIGDEVTIIKDIKHIKEIANYLETIPYEVICSISGRVPRICILQ